RLAATVVLPKPKYGTSNVAQLTFDRQTVIRYVHYNSARIAELTQRAAEYAAPLADSNWVDRCNTDARQMSSRNTWRFFRTLIDPNQTRSENVEMDQPFQTLDLRAALAKMKRGTAPGAVLSPLLFNLAMMHLPAQLGAVACVQHALYPDDITLWATQGSLGDIEANLQQAATIVDRYARRCGLQCSPQDEHLQPAPLGTKNSEHLQGIERSAPYKSIHAIVADGIGSPNSCPALNPAHHTYGRAGTYSNVVEIRPPHDKRRPRWPTPGAGGSSGPPLWFLTRRLLCGRLRPTPWGMVHGRTLSSSPSEQDADPNPAYTFKGIISYYQSGHSLYPRPCKGLSKADERLLLRLYTNTLLCPATLKHFDPAFTGSCPHCGEVSSDIYHRVWACPSNPKATLLDCSDLQAQRALVGRARAAADATGIPN
ncbi:hypothetical protein HPB47_011320, partial [Ixodes persulcatus]